MRVFGATERVLRARRINITTGHPQELTYWYVWNAGAYKGLDQDIVEDFEGSQYKFIIVLQFLSNIKNFADSNNGKNKKLKKMSNI